MQIATYHTAKTGKEMSEKRVSSVARRPPKRVREAKKMLPCLIITRPSDIDERLGTVNAEVRL